MMTSMRNAGSSLTTEKFPQFYQFSKCSNPKHIQAMFRADALGDGERPSLVPHRRAPIPKCIDPGVIEALEGRLKSENKECRMTTETVLCGLPSQCDKCGEVVWTEGKSYSKQITHIRQ